MEDLEDFSYQVSSRRFGPIHFRELKPKDFYFAQILRQQERSYLELLERLILNTESLDEVSSKDFKYVINWANENLLSEKVFTVENWLETGFHLCKQRWDSSMDWLEDQPVSKIMAMVGIVEKFAEKQEEQMKKSARRK